VPLCRFLVFSYIYTNLDVLIHLPAGLSFHQSLTTRIFVADAKYFHNVAGAAAAGAASRRHHLFDLLGPSFLFPLHLLLLLPADIIFCRPWGIHYLNHAVLCAPGFLQIARSRHCHVVSLVVDKHCFGVSKG
jgi:hypothetical protein